MSREGEESEYSDEYYDEDHKHNGYIMGMEPGAGEQCSKFLSDLTLIKTAPENRFAKEFVPDADKNVSDPLVYESLKSFSRPLKEIRVKKRKFEQVAGSRMNRFKFQVDAKDKDKKHNSAGVTKKTFEDPTSKKLPIKKKETPPPEEVDLKLNPEDMVQEKFLRPVNYEMLVQRMRDDGEQEGGAFWKYQPGYTYKGSAEETIVKRTPQTIWKREFGTQILVQCHALEFGLGDIEPFFCKLAVYDLQNKERISEFFHFDLNTDKVLTGTLAVWRYSADKITCCKHALFSLEDRNENIVLVLQIEKVLQGDPDTGNAPYVTDRPSKIDQLSKRVRQTISRLGTYRQTFAWSMVPLFDELGDLKFRETEKQPMAPIYTMKPSISEDQMIGLLTDLNKDPSLERKLKTLPRSQFLFGIQVIDIHLPSERVDPSLIPLKQPEKDLHLDADEKGHQPVVREVEEFPLEYSQTANCMPNTHYVNSMYVYPICVQFQKYQSRLRASFFGNIACKVQLRMSDESVKADGMKTIFGKSSTSAFTTHAYSTINHHIKSPSWQEEIKIMLPFGLNDQAHLFFTFYQVACQHKPGKSIAEEIGYACVPIYKNRICIEDGQNDLHVASKLPAKYLPVYTAKKTNRGAAHYRMNGEPIFKVKLRTLSTVFSQDRNINAFFQKFPTDERIQKDPKVAKTLLIEAVACLEVAEATSVVRFLSSILRYLMKLLATRCDEAKYAAFLGVIRVINKVTEFFVENSERNSILVAWVSKVYDNVGSTPMYAIFCKQWLRALKSIEDENEIPEQESKHYIQYSWFWFEMMLKSMQLELTDTYDEPEQVNVTLEGARRTTLVAAKEFCADFSEVIEYFVFQLFRHRSGFGLTVLKRANSSIAMFLTDLFAVLNERSVVELVNKYLERLNIGKDSVLLEFKMNLLTILFDNDSLIELCNPKPVTLGQGCNDIVDIIKARYPLPALMVSFITDHIEFPEQSGRGHVIDVLRGVLTKLDHHSDFNTPEDRTKIATMFLPLVPCLSEQADVILKDEPKQARNVLICLIWVVRHADRLNLRQWWGNEDETIVASFLNLLLHSLVMFNYVGVEHRKQTVEDKFDTILSPETSNSYFEDSGQSSSISDFKTDIENLMSTLRHTASMKKRSKTQQKTGSAKKKLSLRQKRAQMKRGGSLKRSNSSLTATGQGTLTMQGNKFLDTLMNSEGQLTECASRTVLSVLIDFIYDQHQAGSLNPMKDPDCVDLLSAILHVIIACLRYNLPNPIYLSLYPAIRYFLDHAKNIFQLRRFHDQIGALSRQILRHCTFSHDEIRANAAALLYHISKTNFLACEDFEVFQLSITISLSKMVVELTPTQASYLEQVLFSIKEFAGQDTLWDGPQQSQKFHEGLDKVFVRVNTIFQDTLEIAKQRQLGDSSDAARYEDLLIQMAEAYSHIPEINMDWLQQLSSHHIQHRNYAEAAQCLIRVADLTEEKILKREESFPADPVRTKEVFGGDSFASLARTNERTRATTLYKTPEDNIMEALQKSCDCLDQAELYEQCNDVYKRLLPLYEKKMLYDKLSVAHLNLHQSFKKLIESEINNSRLLGTYYRVGFYGKIFGPEMDHKQFVYKMPKITRLSEVTQMVTEKYGKQLHHKITVRPSSGPITDESLDEEEGVTQITFLQVCPENEEGKTAVERQFNIKKFKFSTPFTASGKAHGDVTAQQKRTTYLTVNHPFPYLKTRQEVVGLEEVILSPVESALDDIVSRIDKFRSVLNEDPVDPKVLTGILSGSILLQVHGGALEICKAFLHKDVVGNFDEKEVQKLKECLKEFIDVCEQGLAKNRQIAAQTSNESQDTELQQEFEKHFGRMCAEMNPYLKRHRHHNVRGVVKFKDLPPGK